MLILLFVVEQGLNILNIYDGIDETWKITSRGISYLDNGKIIISFSHPAARTKDCFLYYALIDAIREILSLSEI